jgi:ABC-type phosphate transport system substrate-binding protein
MKQIKRMTTVLGLLILLSLLAVIEAPENVAGEAFSDPATVLDMSESWKHQPIQHESSIGKADIVIHFNRQVHQALRPLIDLFGKENNLKIVLTRGTCGLTAGMLKNKQVDIGMFCCPPGKTDRLPGLRFHTVGIMSLALLVHPENSIDNITIEQARQIFSGEIRRWSELKDSKGKPGMNVPIQVIARRHCKKRPGHWKQLLEESDVFTPKLQEVGAIPDMIYLIASNPAAIGFEVMQMVRELKDKGEVKPLKIDGISPEVASKLISAQYPLYRTFSLTLWDNAEARNPHAEQLVEYLLEHVEKVDPAYGIIPASDLRQAGWKFKGNELIGEPQ